MGLMQFGYNPIPNPVCGKMGLIQSHLRIVGRQFQERDRLIHGSHGCEDIACGSASMLSCESVHESGMPSKCKLW